MNFYDETIAKELMQDGFIRLEEDSEMTSVMDETDELASEAELVGVPWRHKDKPKIVAYGQYTDTNKPNINWSPIGDSLFHSKFNAWVVHVLSPWGNINNFYPFPFHNDRFDLLAKNDKWYENFSKMVDVMFFNDISLSLAFVDRYFLKRYLPSGDHPFVKNNVGVNWSDSEIPLFNNWKKTGGSHPTDKDFHWVRWITKGENMAERVVDFKPVGKIGVAICGYIAECAKILAAKVKSHPVWSDTMYIRFNNENSMRFYPDGTHEDKGGETKLFEIVQLIFERAGLVHPRDFRMVDDTLIWGEVDALKGYAKSERYLRMFRWLREFHGCTPDFVRQAFASGVSEDISIFSTDALKPEKDPFFTKVNKDLTDMNLRFLDHKVPSELTPYYKASLNKTFDGVIGKMKSFTI